METLKKIIKYLFTNTNKEKPPIKCAAVREYGRCPYVDLEGNMHRDCSKCEYLEKD